MKGNRINGMVHFVFSGVQTQLSAVMALALLTICLFYQPAFAMTDPKLEQGVDAYLLQYSSEPEKAWQSLQALVAQLHEHTPPSTATRIYGTEVLYHFHQGNTEEAEQGLADLLNFARRHATADVMAEALTIKLNARLYQNKLDEAYQVIIALEPYLEHIIQPRIRYFSHNTIGSFYKQDNQFEMASQHLYLAYDAVNETDNERTLLRETYLLGELAQLQADMKNWPLAFELVEKALESASQPELHEFLPDYYLLKGYIEGESGQHEASIATHYKAIEWSEQLQRPDTILVSLNNIGASFILMEQYELAKPVLQQAMTLATQLEDDYTEWLLKMNLGYIDVMQGQHEAGLHVMEEAINYFREHGRKSDLERFLTDFANALQRTGFHIKEARILREQRSLNEELFQVERDRVLVEMQQRFQTRDQAYRINRLEQENELQERLIDNKQLQNQLTMLVAVVITLASLLMWLLYRKVRHTNRRLKEANKQLEFHSLRDPLTGLYNRRSFQQRMLKRDKQLQNRHYQGDEIDALVLIDLDYFKQINDQYGHAVGDDILIEVGKRLTDSLRLHDQAIRWGGEEFLLFLHRINPKDLLTLVERTLYKLSDKPYSSDDESLVVTATAGFITLPFADIDEQSLNWEKALQLADMALYLGKANGRNRACGITGLKVPYAQLPAGFEKDLSQAIAQEHIELVTIVGPEVER